MHDDKRPEAEIKLETPFLKKAENFFYHYKWHTIVAAFLAVVVLICTLQTCSKESYDVEIMYAGPYSFDSTHQTQLDIQKAFASVTPDTDKNGKSQTRLTSYWVNEKYYGGASAKDEVISGADVAYLANNSLTNQEKYLDEITVGNISICLVSPHLFYLVHKEGGFMRIDEMLPELSEDVYHVEESGATNHYGVVLAKTDFGKLAGLSSLPKDTILCLRKPAYRLGNQNRAEEQHAKAKEVFLAALQFKLVED